ncbi:microtubule-associated proteins 1A/1B light chain 3A-like isoform X1 [Stegodyphus dumicola]|uniref:microtubule-associated proteins 1A/1B light chain 3A-like isoform X1 n=1 Tax=Stegodyphus dumicola TaxID=202533 RepID=UPI0015ADE34A|nr:microtubule-associated proteins 1A/1B light chain 3A-like isoform X1 [Stegodyphus dumicola]
MSAGIQCLVEKSIKATIVLNLFLNRPPINFHQNQRNKNQPIIVEKAEGEKSLPTLDRVKFLAPDDMSMSQFIGIIRSRLNLKPTQAFYLMVKNRCITTLSQSVAEVYWEHKDEDGFLYTTYAAHEMYGSDQFAESMKQT